MNHLIQIDNDSGTAKYRQIVQSILGAIEKGELKLGDQIPSLNLWIQETGLSQDTILTAYNELKFRGIISSSVGKGYYVTKTEILEEHHIFVLFDKMTPYKETLYESMKQTAGQKAVLDIYFHHGNQKVFDTLLKNAIGHYTAYMVVPIISNQTDMILSGIPRRKVVILDQGIARYGKKYRSVCQTFEKDIFDSLSVHIERIKKYKKIYFIHQDRRQQFKELENGFRTLCSTYKLKSAVLPGLEEHRIEIHGLYVTVDDKDLFNIIKSCRQQQYVPGQDIGVISYNDTPFKEIIGDGVSTISTDFQLMGQTAIEMILNNRTLHLENPSKLILRNSF